MKFVTCNCMTKTPEPKYHKRNCPVWMADRIKKLDNTLESVQYSVHCMEQAGAFVGNALDQKMAKGIVKKISAVRDLDEKDGIEPEII